VVISLIKISLPQTLKKLLLLFRSIYLSKKQLCMFSERRNTTRWIIILPLFYHIDFWNTTFSDLQNEERLK
jgi:hypothetical protein